MFLDGFIVSYFTSGDQASKQLAIEDMPFSCRFHAVDEEPQPGWYPLDRVSSYAERQIADANCHISNFTSQGMNRVDQANPYRQVETLARVAEKRIVGTPHWLEERINPVDYRVADITVYNELIGESITFYPFHIYG